MRTGKHDRRARPVEVDERRRREEWEPEAEPVEGFDADGGAEPVRVACPECGRPVALAGQGTALPLHALCPRPWDPFGLTVCPGSGRAVSVEEVPAAEAAATGGEPTARLTLPEGLDWRLQPFSHAVPHRTHRAPRAVRAGHPARRVRQAA